MTNNKNTKHWKIAARALPDNLFSAPETREIPDQILTILANRGVFDPAEIRHFLHPSMEQLPPPYLLMGMKEAVAILAEAREAQIPVLIHGDYDADGVTATALLIKYFREIGLSVHHHLPDRFNEGYGLNLESLAILRNLPGISNYAAPILLTVDCGITNINEISAANHLGFRVIVTDHHQPEQILPEAAAIINPHQPGCEFPFKDLAGVGVAFYLAAGLRSELVNRNVYLKKTQPNLKKYLDLVAIGTVADMVPLRGANRILVKVGLELINRTPRPGVKALLDQIDQGTSRVGAETIAFQLAPRLNAAGRTGSAERALQLLLTEDKNLARKSANDLCQANQLRKSLSEEVYNQAVVQGESQIKNGQKVLVVKGEDWHQGVSGLVASKLARDFWRPTVVLAVDSEGTARGSVRSVGNFDILSCLRQCSSSLESCGGHRLAAGITLKSENIERFISNLEEAVVRTIKTADMAQCLEIDLTADPHEIMRERIMNHLQLLEPFGNGNPEPLFCCRPEGIRLAEIKKIGTNSLRFKIKGDGKWFSGIGFGMASWAETVERKPLLFAYKVILNSFRGVEKWEIRLEDAKSLP